jgi:hypothetical protein
MTVQFASGSTAFGNDQADVHQFTGSVSISGSAAVTGAFSVGFGGNAEFIVNATGTKLGNIVTDTHTATGSLRISGSIVIPTAASTTAALGSVVGQIFYNTTDNNIYRYNGTT